ncbi:integrin beta-7 isoform X1 [Erpetoichthys calabaricus]|uniref:integrin beta-7 isoform X1 n=1 Tax=Erpetoichthys calabaricus TaxID=27687 RepID=UPI002234E639|nr:integrin beta-7 isoform X1 [Erpetoichthys calabaricus]
MMSSNQLMEILLLTTMVADHVVAQTAVCVPQPTCEECMMKPGCAWCSERNFTKPGESDTSRCDSEQSLLRRGCNSTQIHNPKNKLHVRKNRTLSHGNGYTVQLMPQHLRLKLRPGNPMSFKAQFKRAEGYPIDLYYLMDLSYSMKDDLEKIKNLGQEILSALEMVTKSVRIGFGSFVDKTVLPYVSTVKAKLKNPCPTRQTTCQAPFSFRNVQPLTSRVEDFKKQVSEQMISGNLDPPEAGFDAMMQAAVCTEQIGWGNVTRLLVYTSDDTFHMAGDGQLGGVYVPNDGACHLSREGLYENSTIYDYPSVGHIARVLSQNNIQPIFAVTEKSVPTYQELSKLIPQSVVGVLQEDSSNIVQLIFDAYNNLSSTVYLEHQQLPPELQVTYDSYCGDNNILRNQKRGECTGVKLSQEINFTVTVTVTACFKESQHIIIKPQGINEELHIEVSSLCGCNCKDLEVNSPYCSDGNGTFQCGICSCNKNRLGRLCECLQDTGEEDTKDLDASCRNGSSLVCNGHGRCECGQCVCSGKHRGQYCECDDMSCPRSDGKLCGGNGLCGCGTCICNENFTGPACECSLSTNDCQKAGKTCSNNGRCRCNRCECNSGYLGKFCQTCTSCNCEKYQECVECHIINKGSPNPECHEKCEKTGVTKVVEDFSDNLKGQPCRLKNFNYDFSFSINNEGDVHIQYAERQGMVDRTIAIVGGSLSGVVLIGLVIIIIYRICIEMYDRREYRQFEKERQKAIWNEANNPLFKSATTTVINPRFIND